VEIAGTTTDAFDNDSGRRLIWLPGQSTVGNAKFSTHINYVRQYTEVGLTLLPTVGVLRALKLKKPAGD
jgi:hypothetical protein